MTATDDAWANRSDGTSTSGRLILSSHQNILRGETVLVCDGLEIVAHRRAVRSSLGSECAALSNGLEHTGPSRVTTDAATR